MGILTIMELIVVGVLLLVGTSSAKIMKTGSLHSRDANDPVIMYGPCQPVTGMAQFDMDLYVGWWHQIESYPTGEEGSCRSSRYTGASPQFQVVDTVVANSNGHHTTYTVTANANGHLTKTVDGVEETWIVLTTDYENYSLLYRCETYNATYRRIWSAKLSKTGELTVESQNRMAQYIQANPNLDPARYRQDDQSAQACFYYPPANGNPVILRGQCDRNIPVISNFDMNQFSGVWYHIEKYPEPWTVGTCSGVRYTRNTEEQRVDIRDWHFVNDVADVIDGFMTPVANNNQARYITSLPSRKSEHDPEITTIISHLDVLATDYRSYALTFSCVNLNRFEQRITAWKLSRSRTISDAVNTDINQHVQTRPELDQQYFGRLTQHDNCRDSGFLVKSSIIVILVSGILQSLL